VLREELSTLSYLAPPSDLCLYAIRNKTYGKSLRSENSRKSRDQSLKPSVRLLLKSIPN
jgi:hypothetical protein